MKNSVINDSWIIFTRLFICNQVHVMVLTLKQSFNYERKLCCNKCILFKHELHIFYLRYLYNNQLKHIHFYKSNPSGALEFCLGGSALLPHIYIIHLRYYAKVALIPVSSFLFWFLVRSSWSWFLRNFS